MGVESARHIVERTVAMVPELRFCLQQNLVCYSALARALKTNAGEIHKDALVSAIRRHANSLRDSNEAPLNQPQRWSNMVSVTFNRRDTDTLWSASDFRHNTVDGPVFCINEDNFVQLVAPRANLHKVVTDSNAFASTARPVEVLEIINSQAQHLPATATSDVLYALLLADVEVETVVFNGRGWLVVCPTSESFSAKENF